MLSKSQIKLITSLKQKKYRKQHQLFVVEGKKGIQELLNSPFKLRHLYTTAETFGVSTNVCSIISAQELKKISFLTTPQVALALFEIPEPQSIDYSGLVVALDNVRDPGNLGTIIRLCDWFGVTHLLCNSETVDCYNPKVVMATMGSITRVNIVYADLETALPSDVPVYGTYMDGDPIYKAPLAQNGVLLMGNEANGIQSALESKVSRRISIPAFGASQETESLNVANAAGICLSEFRRRTIEM